MKKRTQLIYLIILFHGLWSCGESPEDVSSEAVTDHEEESETLHLTNSQVAAMQLEIDTLSHRVIADIVEANGVLEVPPQNEAAVTSFVGANVSSIRVIEGDKVAKGQVLATLSHPNLIQMQTDYLKDWNQLHYLEKEYDRQQKLYQEEVGSGRDVQRTEAELAALKASVRGQESQLSILGIDPSGLRAGKIMDIVPLKSPISGYIKKVHIRTGQYVAPEVEMMEVVNIEHIHADLMVFEKDVYKVKEGQKVRFMVESIPNEELTAEVYAVGKSFEQEPKAVHIHAEIENKKGLLIPGMYVKGQVITEDIQQMAVKEGALVRDGDKHYLFAATEEDGEWNFEPVEVLVGQEDQGWAAIQFLQPEDSLRKYVHNKAYYLMAEMKKGEGGHHH